MTKIDIIVAAVLVAIFVVEVIVTGWTGVVIGPVNFLGGAFAFWYYLMRKGVLG